MDKQRIVQELSLHPFGNKGWMHSESTPCTFKCGKSDKFGILFTSQGAIVKCMRCGESTSLFNYLISIDRSDLIEHYSAPLDDSIKSFDTVQEKQSEYQEQEIKLPVGFKRIYFDDYLDERGFTPKQYNLFKVGVSNDIRLKNHLVFPLYQDGKLVSWLARSKHSKEWHKENIKKYKAGGARLVLRYYNAEDTIFEDILGGYDEITENTKSVILVEGLTDKANIDRKLNLNSDERKKCCYTFGKNLSKNQIKLLLKKGVNEIVLMYDPDALKEIEKFSLQYINKFYSILCAKLEGDNDPGDLSQEEVSEVMNKLYNPIDFYITNIKKIS